MHTIVQRIKIILLHVLIIDLYMYSVNGCLTWSLDGNSIKFICRIESTSTVNLFDNYGHNVARCNIIGSSGNCSSSSFVKSTIQENAVMFYIDRNRQTGVNGNWSCLQQNNIFTAEVLTTKDITDSTTVNLLGKIVQDKDVHRLLLTCSSCRIPKGKSAEFLMNNRTVDHITFNDDSGKCTHMHGVCIAGTCNCSQSGNTFTRMFVLSRPLKTPTYFACDLRFENEANSVVFSKVPTVSFNGIEFENRGTHTVIPKLSYDPNRPKETDKGKETAQVVIAVCSTIILSIILLALLVLLYRKSKKRKSEKIPINGADSPLIEKTSEKMQINGADSPLIERKSEKMQINGADSPFIETIDKSFKVNVEDKSIQHDRVLQDVEQIQDPVVRTETNDKSFKVNVEEECIQHDRVLQDVEQIQDPVVQIDTHYQSISINFVDHSLLPDKCLQDVEWIQEPDGITETNDKSFLVNFEEDNLRQDMCLQDKERIQDPFVQTETNDQSTQVNFEEVRLLHETNDQCIQVNFEENIILNETNKKSIRVNVEEDNRLLDIYKRVLTRRSMEISLSRPAHSADAKLDVLFMNCITFIESQWVSRVAEVLEREFGLLCGIPLIDIDSFKSVSETTKIVITFSEKSARLPDAWKMAEFLPAVVIVMVEECSIPIQLTNMKCVDATQDIQIWLKQLMIALKLRKP
ncbi:uncharacterized protein LOC134683031 isoform X2 [Mytilus trossulus]|uniref:uncharacterized protein LOC134683031 isoform X2 n=1 Tax=Mytilus trossulus TaxID=6551 RepID=UPI003005D163